MDRRFTVLIGIGLIILGTFILFSEYGYPFRLRFSWPVILIVIGGAMIIAFLTSKPKHNYLFGGSLVLWLGIFFLLMENLLKYHYGYGSLWPGFIIVLGLAHLTTAVLRPSMHRHIIPAIIFIGIGAVLLVFTLGRWRGVIFDNLLFALSIAIIILGFALVVQFFIRTGRKGA